MEFLIIERGNMDDWFFWLALPLFREWEELLTAA